MPLYKFSKKIDILRQIIHQEQKRGRVTYSCIL